MRFFLNKLAKKIQNAQFELKVATEKAQAAITNVEGMIKALDLALRSPHLSRSIFLLLLEIDVN